MSEFDENVTVEDFLFGPCSRSILAGLAQDNEYWETVLDFIMENEDMVIAQLKPREKRLVFKAYNGLLDKAGL